MRYIPEKGTNYYEYAVVNFGNSFIYFGGYSSGSSSVITKFDSTTRQWSDLGNLVTSRYLHSSIFVGSYFLVVGGNNDYESSLKTEKCTLSDSFVTCQQQLPELNQYLEYPEVFTVSENFCKKTQL